MASESAWNSQVRWAECDAAGIIYHARVFDWFSEGRIAWLRDHALDYYEVLRPRGVDLLVKSAHAAFRHTLHPGDAVKLLVTVEELSFTRVSFCYRVLTPQNLEVEALSGITEHAFVADGRAKRLDRFAPDIMERFEQAL